MALILPRVDRPIDCSQPNDEHNRIEEGEEWSDILAQNLEQFQSVTAKVNKKWLERRSDDLCEIGSKDP